MRNGRNQFEACSGEDRSRRRFSADEFGATAVEYALVVGLVGIGIIASVTTLQGRISELNKRAGLSTRAGIIKAPTSVSAGSSFNITIEKDAQLTASAWIGMYKRSAPLAEMCRTINCFNYRAISGAGPGSPTGTPGYAFSNPSYTFSFPAPDGTPNEYGWSFPPGDYELRMFDNMADYTGPVAVMPIRVT